MTCLSATSRRLRCTRTSWRDFPSSVGCGTWCEACLVVSGGHPLRHFADEVSDEHMGFLDPWHRRGRDIYGDIGDVRQFPVRPEEGHRSGPELLGRAYRLNHVRGAATRAEADDEIVTTYDRFHLATKGR